MKMRERQPTPSITVNVINYNHNIVGHVSINTNFWWDVYILAEIVSAGHSAKLLSCVERREPFTLYNVQDIPAQQIHVFIVKL